VRDAAAAGGAPRVRRRPPSRFAEATAASVAVSARSASVAPAGAHQISPSGRTIVLRTPASRPPHASFRQVQRPTER
jgi:hypothetical protein